MFPMTVGFHSMLSTLPRHVVSLLLAAVIVGAWLPHASAAADVSAAELRAAAARGDATSQVQYGDWLMHGSGGLEKDEKAAASWYAKAANQGDPWGMYRLGGATLTGSGVPKDVPQAMALYRKCSGLALSLCTQSLAIHHATGRLIPKNIPEAERLFELAWKQGDSFVTWQVGQFYWLGTTLPKSLPKAALWFSRCSDQLGCRLSAAEVEKELAAERTQSLFPARPTSRAGVTSCNTRCNNGDCYRTYDDGRQVRFRARQTFNPMTNQFEWDAGSC